MDKSFERQLTKTDRKEMENLKSLIFIKEIKCVITVMIMMTMDDDDKLLSHKENFKSKSHW